MKWRGRWYFIKSWKNFFPTYLVLEKSADHLIEAISVELPIYMTLGLTKLVVILCTILKKKKKKKDTKQPDFGNASTNIWEFYLPQGHISTVMSLHFTNLFTSTPTPYSLYCTTKFLSCQTSICGHQPLVCYMENHSRTYNWVRHWE